MPLWEIVIIVLGVVEAAFLGGLFLSERRWRTH
jgi:hypothetical protein